MSTPTLSATPVTRLDRAGKCFSGRPALRAIDISPMPVSVYSVGNIAMSLRFARIVALLRSYDDRAAG